MSFIKFKEEKKWNEWKAKEEILLREHNVSEDVIKMLYEYDWKNYNRERSFGERQTVSDKIIQWRGQSNDTYEITNMEELLDQLSDINLYNLLKNSDSITKIIVFMKFQGYSSKEISMILHKTVRSIDCKIYRLRKKYKSM